MSLTDSLCRMALVGLLGPGLAACSSDDEMDAPSSVTTQLQESPDAGLDAALPPRLATDIVLVHGAWADGSSWSHVIPLLQDVGFTVQAVQLPETSVAADADVVRNTIQSIPRPVVVAGHSYGGFVMSEATAGLENVAALVFVAAFAPDEGETIGGLAGGYPVTPAIQNLVVDDLGNTLIEPSAFAQYFASDVPPRDARVLAAVQHPTALSILGTPAGVPGWRTIPTFYQVSTNDEVIAPDLLRFFAERMGAETIELVSSHVSMISHPGEVADLIVRAATAP